VAHCAANLLEATPQCRGRTSVVGRCQRTILSSSYCPGGPSSAVQALNCRRVGGASAEQERTGADVAWNLATAEGAAPVLGCRSAGSGASRHKEYTTRGHGRPASGHHGGRHTGVRLPSASATSPWILTMRYQVALDDAADTGATGLGGWSLPPTEQTAGTVI
jgi:hypothetical protein